MSCFTMFSSNVAPKVLLLIVPLHRLPARTLPPLLMDKLHRDAAVPTPLNAAGRLARHRTLHRESGGLHASLVWVSPTLMAIVMTIALGLATYMSYVSLTGSPIVGCGSGGTFSCDHVLSSHWSKVAGIPVGLPATGLYIVGLGSLFVATRSTSTANRRRGWWTVGTIGLAATLTGIWFTGLQIFVIKHFCMYCLAAHTCGALLFGLYIVRRGFGRLPSHAAMGVIGVAPLISAQLLIEPPPTYRLEPAVAVAVPGGEELLVGSEMTAAQPASSDAAATDTVTGGEFSFESPVAATAGDLFESPAGASTASESTAGESTASESPVFESPAAETPPVTFEAPASPEPDAQSSSTDASMATPEIDRQTPKALETSDSNARDRSDHQMAASLGWLSIFSPIGVVVADETIVSEESEQSDTKQADAEVAAPAPRMIPVSAGKRQLNIDQWPLWGSGEAKYVVAMMFDYTCPHCQSTHRAIREAATQMPEGLAVLALPIPLYRGCNSASQTTDTRYAFRCEVAKIGVAVWLADASKYTAFHDWMMDADRTLAQTRQYADQTVGAGEIEKQLNSGVPQQFIDKHVFLYREAGAGTVPKLVFPTTTLVGEIGSGRAIADIIRRNAK